VNAYATKAPATPAVDEGLRAFFNGTYKQMTYAMILTGVVAWLIGMDLKSVMAGGGTSFLPQSLLMGLFSAPMVYGIVFAPLAFVLFLGLRIHKMSESAARTSLYAFAGLMGLSLASAVAVYTAGSIAQAFFATAAAFAGLSLFGYTTQKDLTGMGRFMIMGVIGLVVVSIINVFVGSEPMSMAISTLAVIIFSALTAYDTQRLKSEYLIMRDAGVATAEINKASIMGALSLYLNFINIFMSLLNLFGQQE